jgi:hypothetical protein
MDFGHPTVGSRDKLLIFTETDWPVLGTELVHPYYFASCMTGDLSQSILYFCDIEQKKSIFIVFAVFLRQKKEQYRQETGGLSNLSEL